jgi:hypothetical protein
VVTTEEGRNRRRSDRVALRIPVEIYARAEPYTGSTAVVNDDGALVLSPIPCRLGDLLRMKNLNTGDSALFRVRGARGRTPHWGGFPLGVEIIDGSGPAFWGPQYRTVAGPRRP